MEELGTHFKLEEFNCNKQIHETNLMFSSGRNCLRFILRKRNIKRILIPYFLCETVTEAAINENVEIVFYHIDNEFIPIIDDKLLMEDIYIYLVNYYGLLSGKKINDFVKNHKNVIIDNTHNFYDTSNYLVDTIYNFRKYFGVPDGACVVGEIPFDDTISRSKSLQRIIEFVEREESGKYFHYSTFMEADQYFHNEELVYISKFSENYLKGINYGDVFQKRITNFKILHDSLNDSNLLEIPNNLDVNFMYPLLVDDGVDLRNYLRSNNVYSILLWPNVFSNGANDLEQNIARNMILLPIDQRYGDIEMDYIVNSIKKYKKLIK